ncbi:hypothetical protein BGW80DRAFT_1304324 [Lactifluus volemus]|nr:hypothetical protein BGW80DRAFT_1304324 [Lactifluus volemus]
MLARSGVAHLRLIDSPFPPSIVMPQPPSLTSARQTYSASHARCMLSHHLCRSIHA